MAPRSALATTVLTRAVLLPTEEFDLVQRIENDHGVSTVPGLIAMLRVRPDLLKGCSANLLDWLSIVHNMPADDDNTTARLHVTTNASNAPKMTRHAAPSRTRARTHDSPAVATAAGTEIPSALSFPLHGALPTGTTWRTAWARGDDLNLHPHAGMSLGELGDMGYDVATWRRREKGVNVHVVPEAEARLVSPHPDGTRGARADGAVVAKPVPDEVECKPPLHITTPMDIPLSTGMSMAMGAGFRMGNLAAMLETMRTQHSEPFGGPGMGGELHAGFVPMRRGRSVFVVPHWRTPGVRA